MRPEKYLRYIVPAAFFDTSRTKEILQATPAPNTATRLDADKIEVTVYDYDADTLHVTELKAVQESFPYKGNGRITWINIDGLCKTDVEKAGAFWGIHPLIVEDILPAQYAVLQRKNGRCGTGTGKHCAG
jgi:magnesium transporter